MDNYDVDYFIKKFEAIPDDLWITGVLRHEVNPDCCCALGHCGVTLSEDGVDFIMSDEAMALSRILKPLSPTHDPFAVVYNINDDRSNLIFPGKTPKERILNQLYFKKEQE